MKRFAPLVVLVLAVLAFAGSAPTPPVHVWDTGGDPALVAQEAYRDRCVDFFVAEQAAVDARVAAKAAQDAWIAAANVPPPAAPTATLSVAPPSIVTGAIATLSYTFTGGTGVLDGVTLTAASGTQDVAPAATTTYALVVTGAGGTATASATVTVTQPVPIPPTSSDFAWTPIPAPSADTRTIYVSPNGNDANDGLSPATALRNPYKATEKTRKGFPDRVLFERGGVFPTNTAPLQMTGWQLPVGRATWIPSRSGRSATEPAVYATYGTGPRPVLVDGRFQVDAGQGSFLFVTGIEFRAGAFRETTATGVYGLDGGADIVFEDLLISGYVNNVTFQGQNAPINRLKFRGCVLVDSYRASGGGHSQGLHVTNAHDLLIEGCVLDHNGWNSAVSGAVQTAFNHNVYVQYNCSGVVYRNNVSARASSHGAQLRTAGACDENLFLANPIACLFGADGKLPNTGGSFSQNVVLDGGDIDPTNRRGWGVDFIGLTIPTDAHHNVFAHNVAGTGGPRAICLGNGQAGSESTTLTIRDNVSFKFGHGLMVATNGVAPITVTRNRFEATSGAIFRSTPQYQAPQYALSSNLWWTGAPAADWYVIAGVPRDFASWTTLSGETGSSAAQASYPDSSRSIATYAASLGLAPTLDAFLVEARKLSRDGPQRPEFFANRVNAYIRAGFGVSGN